MVENNDMRETLQNMQTELINLLNQQNDNYESNTEVGKKIILLLLLVVKFIFKLSGLKKLIPVIQDKLIFPLSKYMYCCNQASCLSTVYH